MVDESRVSTASSFVQLHPKTKPTKKRALEDIEDWDNHHTYMVLKKRKLQSQFDALKSEGMSSKSAIFEGVTIYVNGWTEPSAAELKELVYEHGGKYEYNVYGRSTVTHTIASNLPNAKILKIGKSVVCRPEWIVDSVAAKEKLPVENYLLYKDQEGQTKLKFPVSKTLSENLEKDSKVHNLQSLDVPEVDDHGAEVHTSPTAGDELTKAPSGSDKADFVKEFFAHSRLHYLSTWGVELKQFLAGKLRSVSPKISKLTSSESLRCTSSRAVVHIDLDCFFVSVSLKKNPHLRGQPVAVTHAKRNSRTTSDSAIVDNDDQSFVDDGGQIVNTFQQEMSSNYPKNMSNNYPSLQDSTSDIASCSYEARAFGISNGMSVGMAVKKCPDLVLLPYDFEAYREVSRQFYSILVQYSSVIEAVSCDEAYIEFTDFCRSYDQVVDLVGELRAEVANETGCTVSAGIAHNMLLARMSTRMAKPDGQFLLLTDQVGEFLSNQRIRDLPGVGRSTAAKLQQEMGSIENCGELQAVPLTKLQAMFGSKFGRILFDSCRGVDDRELKTSTERKSVSVDINFGIRFKELSEAETLIGDLAEELQRRSEKADVCGTQITLKMKMRKKNAPREPSKYMGHGACDNVSRSMALLQPVRDAGECGRLAVKLLRQLKPVAEDIRGMGLQLSKLVSHAPAEGSSKDGRVGGAQGQQQLKLVKPDPKSSSSTDVDRENSSEGPPVSIPSLQQHQRLKKTIDLLPKKVLSPKTSKPRRRRRGGGVASSAITKRSPLKKSPVKSPVKSPSKSLRQYFKRVPHTKTTLSGATGMSTEEDSRLVSTDTVRSLKAVRNLDDSFNIDLPPASQLDQGVLDSLPRPMRERIIARYSERVPPGNQDSLTKSAADLPTSLAGATGVTEGEDEEEEVVIPDEGILVEDWKKDIREWTESFTEGPSADDLLKVATHFCKMAATNLKMVEVCMKIFRRFLLSRELWKWTACYNTLLEQIQEKVWLVYQGALKIEPLKVEPLMGCHQSCPEHTSDIL